ncbi:MAG: murein biosynthesis integral membrane protein MurJ [Caldilineaceae bacterium]|nr:murein biosynthesis integral membrane protein MurJ [Caldilineaceae bacterium]
METAADNQEIAQTEQPAGLDSRRMFSAALVVMVFFVLSRVTGLAREVVIGAQFGTSAGYDAYLAAFRVPDLLFQLVAGGALASAFIPTFSTYWVAPDRQEAWLLFSRVLNLITLLLVVLAGVAALFAEPIVRHILAPGFAAEQQALTASLMRLMLISTVIFGASGLIMGVLNALQHFVAPAAAPVIYNLSILAGAWLLGPIWGVYGLAAGVVVGALLHFAVQLPALARQRPVYRTSLSLADPGVREVARLMGPRVLGLFFVQLHFLVNTILASGLATGSLSALNYAWLLMLLPQGIIAQALATAAFPTFSAQVAAGQLDALRRTFSQTLRVVLFLSLPAAVVLFVLREPTVSILLERGEFTQRSTDMVTFALQFYLLGLMAHALLEIVVRAFYALHNTMTPVLIGVAAMLLNIGLSILLVRPLSFGGLALANSVATTLEAALLLWLLKRRMAGTDGRAIARTLLRSAVATGITALGLWLWLLWVYGQHALPLGQDWLAALGGIGLAGVIYVGISYVLRSDELRVALGLIRRR